MARIEARLTDWAVKRASRPGAYHDGRGLYLHIGPTGGKSWLGRYQLHGKQRWMGLGAYPDIGLGKARELWAKARELKAQGIDPLQAKAEKRAVERAEAAKAITFKACADR
jgi:hypothetical protein